MTRPSDENALRDTALHRGFLLVKSRKRTLGSGDYGKFGLTDADGNKIFGFGEDGLNASAEDIEQYLRTGSHDTWRTSAASATPISKVPRKSPATPDSGRPRTKDAPAPRIVRTSTKAKVAAPDPPPKKADSAPAPLRIRKANKEDARALTALLGDLKGSERQGDDIATRFASFQGRGRGLLVADASKIVGLVAWSVIPTLQHGLAGRISAIVVADTSRRRGIGSALLKAAEDALAKAGCTIIEAMSDIEIRNAHGFFRAAKFEQASYRFAKHLPKNP